MLKAAISLIQSSCTMRGILASDVAKDNYQRIWARDSVIAGIAGIMANDASIISGFKDSLITLKNGQSELGIIPSNVQDEHIRSYGGIAGRVDATLWYIIGVSLLILNEHETTELKFWKNSIDQAHKAVCYWEYNGQHLIYTPTSGNWADEYPVRGHTLYDNMLRLWGLSLSSLLFQQDDYNNKISEVKEKISINFWPTQDQLNSHYIYHPRAYEDSINPKRNYWCTSIGPEGFNDQFDCAGNALMLLSGLATVDQVNALVKYLKELFFDIKHSLVPAFWPPIFPDSHLWHELEHNYSFSFKNHPYQFHNGAVWPVWMGLLCLGLSKYGQINLIREINMTYSEHLRQHDYKFHECIRTDTFSAAGQERLVFSAAGAIFMSKATDAHVYHKLKFEL